MSLGPPPSWLSEAPCINLLLVGWQMPTLGKGPCRGEGVGGWAEGVVVFGLVPRQP